MSLDFFEKKHLGDGMEGVRERRELVRVAVCQPEDKLERYELELLIPYIQSFMQNDAQLASMKDRLTIGESGFTIEGGENVDALRALRALCDQKITQVIKPRFSGEKFDTVWCRVFTFTISGTHLVASFAVRQDFDFNRAMGEVAQHYNFI
jgi:hypothetical protein